MIGHNTLASDHLKSTIERIERLEEEKKAIADDIRDVYAEAKSNGFDVKALRAIVRLRKQDSDQRREHEAILETYMHALGMLADTPLGQAAVKRATDNRLPPRADKTKPADTSDPPFAAPPADEPRVADPDDIPGFLDRRDQPAAT